MLEALRDALAGGPAILPHPGIADRRPGHGSAAGRGRRRDQRIDRLRRSGSPSAQTRCSPAPPHRASALDGQGQWLLALPAHYIAGINVLVRSIAAGDRTGGPRPAATSTADVRAAAGEMASPMRFTSLVPAQLSRLIAADGAARNRCAGSTGILVGGQATPPALSAAASNCGLNITRSYGSSETCGGCVYDGMPIGNTRVRIVDGRVELAGSVLAEGYLDAELTEEAFRSEAGTRWYRTNDSGQLDDGRLQITGRVDDVIVSGGVKVSLAAIERVRPGAWTGCPGQSSSPSPARNGARFRSS